MELAESFVPPGQDVMEYANFHTGNIEVVEHTIDSGYLQEISYYGVVAIKDLVASGRLDMMQRVANLRYSPRRNIREWAMEWREILKRVCYRGDCAMVQWALEHPMGRRARTLLKRDDQLFQLLWNAVAGGSSVAILQSLKNSG
ncbi:hypothetical protein V7S43_015175 [Phytophthora oleae]|uniref:Uncharacterized protein n=1 Tax=Phytophthora oleae TaxID=2107226 RepID=A0ABD3EZJ3_9STRA